MNGLAFQMPGGWEWIILLVLGLLLFGKRLPEVGRSLGKGIVEFKRGIQGMQDEIEHEARKPAHEPLPGPGKDEQPASAPAPAEPSTERA